MTIPHPLPTDRTRDLAADYAVCAAMSPEPWTDGLDMDPPDSGIESGNCGTVCHIQDHGNINTVARTGEEFSHADARGIALARTALPAAIRLLSEAQARIAELERKAADQEEQLVRIAHYCGKDARHAKDGTIAGMVVEEIERLNRQANSWGALDL